MIPKTDRTPRPPEDGEALPIFRSTKNTRPVLRDSLQYIRSDVPTEVSESEKEWLLAHGIRAVIDLRTEKERQNKPCPLADDARFSYTAVPLAGGDAVPQSPADVPSSYIGMVDEIFEELIEFLLTARTGVLYFCNAGKDRTGVVSAALLHRLGRPLSYIVGDYMLSKTNLETVLAD